MFMTFGDEQSPLSEDESWVYTRLRLAERFHWTLDAVDALTWDDLQQINALTTADNKRNPKTKENDLPL